MIAGSRLADLNFCIADGKAVFLDVARDRYFALSADLSRFASGRLSHVVADADEIVAVVKALLPFSMGERHPNLCRRPPPVVVEFSDDAWTWSLWACLPALLARMLFYKFLLRAQGLDRTLRRLQSRRRVIQSNERRSYEELATIAAATSALKKILPLTDQCLPVALAVAACLLRRGHVPQLVFGVMARPFRAHSWVQVDALLVTDRIEAVQNFTPILVL